MRHHILSIDPDQRNIPSRLFYRALRSGQQVKTDTQHETLHPPSTCLEATEQVQMLLHRPEMAWSYDWNLPWLFVSDLLKVNSENQAIEFHSSTNSFVVSCGEVSLFLSSILFLRGRQLSDAASINREASRKKKFHTCWSMSASACV